MGLGRVQFVDVTAPSALGPLGVLVHHPDPDHCGVLFTSGGKAEFLHLASHKVLLRQDVPSRSTLRYAWVAPPLARERCLAVAALCRRIWKRHEEHGLPYGLRYDATTFTQTGELRLGHDEVGLTCATFVLAVFRSGGIELLRCAEWVERPDDIDRQRALVAMLRDDPSVPPSHVDAIDREVRSLRYRPTEVAAACEVLTLPCSFADATRGAESIVRMFLDRGAVGTQP